MNIFAQKHTWTFLIVSCCLVETQVQADDDCGCDSVLQQDLEKYQAKDEVSLAYLKIIDEAQFNRYKKMAGFGIDIPIEGVPIGASANWGQFQDQRAELFRKEKYFKDEHQSRELLKSKLSKDAIEAWLNCKLNCNSCGLGMRVIAADPKSVVVQVTWRPQAGLTNAAVFESVQLSGADPNPDCKKGTTLDVNGNKIFLFKRIKKTEFHLAINANGQSAMANAPIATKQVEPTPAVVTQFFEFDLVFFTGNGRTNPQYSWFRADERDPKDNPDAWLRIDPLQLNPASRVNLNGYEKLVQIKAIKHDNQDNLNQQLANCRSISVSWDESKEGKGIVLVSVRPNDPNIDNHYRIRFRVEALVEKQIAAPLN